MFPLCPPKIPPTMKRTICTKTTHLLNDFFQFLQYIFIFILLLTSTHPIYPNANLRSAHYPQIHIVQSSYDFGYMAQYCTNPLNHIGPITYLFPARLFDGSNLSYEIPNVNSPCARPQPISRLGYLGELKFGLTLYHLVSRP